MSYCAALRCKGFLKPRIEAPNNVLRGNLRRGVRYFANGAISPVANFDSGADKRPLPSNTPPKQAATLEQKRSLQAL